MPGKYAHASPAAHERTACTTPAGFGCCMQGSEAQVNAELRQENQKRFSRDLEFLSALSNPHYLHQLSQQGFLSDPAFLRYLEYLGYFRRPQYAKYLVYPQALKFLELLQHEEFRLAVGDTAWPHDTAAKQLAHWATWRAAPGEEGEQRGAAPPAAEPGEEASVAKHGNAGASVATSDATGTSV